MYYIQSTFLFIGGGSQYAKPMHGSPTPGWFTLGIMIFDTYVVIRVYLMLNEDKNKCVKQRQNQALGYLRDQIRNRKG